MRYLLVSLLSICVCFPTFAQGISTENLRLRESIPGQPNGAGFGIIFNETHESKFLISANISIAEDTQVHEHVHANGAMRMQRMSALEIPAGGSVTLQPGGYHLMLMGLKEPLVAGTEHEVTLLFQDGSSWSGVIPVVSLMKQHEH